jgi:hypothetical protein
MSNEGRMTKRIAQILASNPGVAFDFYCAASEIVDDFEDYGPVLQADEHGEYSEETTIRELQLARKAIIELLRRDSARSGG